MTFQQQTRVAQYAASVANSNPKVPLAIVLVGSVARGTESAKSDIDLLLIGDNALYVPRYQGPLHVEAMTKDIFTKRLEEGDDFTAWSIRFGQPLKGRNYWRGIVSSYNAAVWPRWQRKIPFALQRLFRAAAYLKIHDLEAAAEETLSSADHTARAVLLHEHVFPHSRAELAKQLKDVGWSHFGQTLDHLTDKTENERSLYRNQIYLKSVLLSLDRQLYKECAQRHSEIARRKAFEIDAAANSRIAGFMRLLLQIRLLIVDEATKQGVQICGIEVRPAWSTEYDEDRRVIIEVKVKTEANRRFRFWEALSERLNVLAETSPSRDAKFLQDCLSLIVSRPYGV